MATSAEVARLDPITKAFLEGVYDEKCVLFKLKGLWNILQEIWRLVKKYWRESVNETWSMRYKEASEGVMVSYMNFRNPNYRSFRVWECCGQRLTFPKPKNIKINMMPFILNDKFKKTRLPKYLKAYWKAFGSNCAKTCSTDREKVCYLTIHESEVEENSSQRRPGIHTERPGKLELRCGTIDDIDKGQGDTGAYVVTDDNSWGVGRCFENSMSVSGGIFMASNVANSCRVWDCQIMDDSCIGHLGNVEHLRSLLPESEVMKPNCMYWITDRTPHESLPLKKKTYRQFFRLVTSQVSLWFEDHSTKNPLGVVPDPNITKIVKGSKFKKGEAYIVSYH